MVDAANRFVADNDSRRCIFGRFTMADIAPKKALLKSTSTQTLIVEKMEE